MGRASRPPGREFQALAWTSRHPGFVAVPLIVLGLALLLGPILAAILLGALAASVAVWGRAHPASFDRFAAPALRATWRRWTVYRGRRWAQLMSDTGLTKEHRHTGDLLVPRVLRVRSSSRSIDTVYVRMAAGRTSPTGRNAPRSSGRRSSRTGWPSPATAPASWRS
ncbi:hypothetical protein WY02_25840 [Pseudonocardia sp. AL041005-10]|nr:hypothetical protein WY02_25840 [Pseudonocardia sp. AL041005-10]